MKFYTPRTILTGLLFSVVFVGNPVYAESFSKPLSLSGAIGKPVNDKSSIWLTYEPDYNSNKIRFGIGGSIKRQQMPEISNTLTTEEELEQANQAYKLGNYSTALMIYQKLANQGNANANNALGILYFNAQGVTQDYQQAVSLFQKAIQLGNVDAQSNLGIAYYHGKGVKQDYQQAFNFFQKAASQGHKRAQRYLAYMYENGLGVKADKEQAAYWISKATAQNKK